MPHSVLLARYWSVSKIVIVLSILVSLSVVTFSQVGPETKPSPTTRTSTEQLLIDGSKKAIIETGISETYFNAHFKLLEVVDKPADKRVNWEFTVNGYETVVRDSIGFSMQGAARVYMHSVAGALGQTAEITNTLSRSRALKILRSCLGPRTTTPIVEYGPVDGQAQLLLVAHSINRVTEDEREREREREKEKREKAKAASRGGDMIESEEEEGRLRPAVTASVNLQTGKCTKSVGLIAP